jgi:5-methylcytosine-specific restriction endonuclease McrA
VAARSWPNRHPACSSCRKPHSNKGALCKACFGISRRTLIQCPRCGHDFWPWAKNDHARQFCSLICARRPKRLKPAREPKPCLYCLVGFIGKNTRQACCSATCRQRYESKRRKLRLKGLTPKVIPVARIRQRDGDDCGLCGHRIDFTVAYPHPMAATIDHVIPITKGGAHAEENVQLAHARCNTSKGNRVAA